MKINISCGPQRLKQKDKLGGYILGNSFCPKCITKNISHTISVFVSYIFFPFAISYPSFFFLAANRKASKQSYMLSVKLILISFPSIVVFLNPLSLFVPHKNMAMQRKTFSSAKKNSGCPITLMESPKESAIAEKNPENSERYKLKLCLENFFYKIRVNLLVCKTVFLTHINSPV